MIRRLLPLGVLALLAGCATAPRRIAAPAPPAPLPILAPPPPPLDWRDAAETPGTWRYVATAADSRALFGDPTALVLRCARAARTVTIERTGAAAGTLTITTTYAARGLSASAIPAGTGVVLAANDPLLDQIAFSRGRFEVEAPGVARLIVPAWAEPARVIEDCRAPAPAP